MAAPAPVVPEPTPAQTNKSIVSGSVTQLLRSFLYSSLKKDCLKVKNLKTFYKITIISYYQIPCIFSVVDFHFSLLNPDPHIECVPVHPDSHYVTLWKRFETNSA